MIFGKAKMEQVILIKKILDTFCDFFEHHINTNKTIICFSKGVYEDKGKLLCELLGFWKVHNLRPYLGVPLFHKRATSNSLRLVVEKVKARLQQWEVRKLSLVGSLLLNRFSSKFLITLRRP